MLENKKLESRATGEDNVFIPKGQQRWAKRRLAELATPAGAMKIQLRDDLVLLDETIQGLRKDYQCRESDWSYHQSRYYEVEVYRNRRLQLERAYRRILARGPRRPRTYAIENFRWRFVQFMKNKVEDAVVESVVGCSAPELRARFEALFSSGMTWENHGPQKRGRPRRWNVDHIRPLASFDDLSDPAQFRAAWHFSNLQPLWAKDNGLKKDKWDGDVTKPTVFL
jgi:hypothetical protein